MAFIDDHMTIVGDEILNLLLAMQTLKYRDVNVSASFSLAAANLADLVDRNIKGHCQPFAPLIKQLLPVNHD